MPKIFGVLIESVINAARNSVPRSMAQPLYAPPIIESGAWEGEYLSNSLFFERKRNWTGLLVEPNRLAFKTMVLRGTRQRSVCQIRKKTQSY